MLIMKIGIIARTWFTSSKGGSERYIKELCDELKKGNEVIVITFEKSIEDFVLQIKLPRIPFVTQFLFSFLAARKINAIRPDICLVNQYWGEFSPLLLRIPWISIIYDVGLFTSERAKKERLKHIFRVKILRLVTRKAKTIIVPSKLTSTDLQMYLGVNRKKIRSVPIGINLEKFMKDHIPHKGVNILCVARIAPNKGLDVLLKAFKLIKRRHPNFNLYLVGGTSKAHEEYYKKLRCLVEEEKIDDVIFTGVVSEDELIKYYMLADIYVQPSIGEEGWGITVIEAFASKIPVVCTEIFKETGVADPERSLIVKPGDFKQLGSHRIIK